MEFWVHLREAMLNILSAKLRSILAILGILVGTGAVVALITSSELATDHALAQFKTLGTHLLAVNISPSQEGQGDASQQGKFELSDVLSIQTSSDQIVQVAPYVTLFESIVYHGKSFEGSVLGADEAFATVAKVHIAKGRFTSFLDKTSLHAVIGSHLAEELRQQGLFDPIGHQILLNKFYFTIIGVMKPWQPNMFIYIRMNDSVVVPIQASYMLSSYASINNLLIKLTPDSNVPLVQKKVEDALRNILPTAQINVHSPEQILKLVGKQQATFTWLLAAIGGISLLVGGIGVMNIMLVSVVERRREIGIRLAIGAQQKDILIMFLIESVMLTLFGGILGIMVGLTVSYIIAYVSGWGFEIFLLPPALGFIVSVVVGILSGFYPALRASRLDPIESLHAD